MNLQFSDKVERWPLERLIPHARNARTHSEAQVAQIAGSIVEFGFVNPVLVGDDSVIVAGHGRVMAARKLDAARTQNLRGHQRSAAILVQRKQA
jgi:ParB-like chromosome segregation protein Spo0J